MYPIQSIEWGARLKAKTGETFGPALLASCSGFFQFGSIGAN
jgi:hypothetical protein